MGRDNLMLLLNESDARHYTLSEVCFQGWFLLSSFSWQMGSAIPVEPGALLWYQNETINSPEEIS